MRELDQMIEVRKKLKEIDTLLYEIVRDYRVSGHPMDNKLMREMANSTMCEVADIWNRSVAIKREALKSHVTGV